MNLEVEDIRDKGLVELRQLLLEGKIKSKDIVLHYLKSIEEEPFNAFIDVFKEASIIQAEKADELIVQGKGKDMPLLGLPVALKDIIVTDFAPTSCASKMLQNYRSPFNATVVSKLIEAGAIIIGRTNMDEFAMGSSNEHSFYGAVKNPWGLDRVPGGSSGGSAVAVAGRLVPAALGTDTGGSIRQPAAYCNISGLKPTYGRVSRYGLIAFASSLDQIGPMAKDAEDCALLLEVISGYDPNDSTSSQNRVDNYLELAKSSLNKITIGVVKQSFTQGVDDDVIESFQRAISDIEKMGVNIIEVDLPHLKYSIPAYYIIAPAEASSNLARYDGIRYGYRAEDYNSLDELYSKTRSEGFGKEVKRRVMIGTYVLSSGYFDQYYIKAQKVRRVICDEFLDAFRQCDLLLMPTAPNIPFKIGQKKDDPLQMYLNDIFTIGVNLAGLPAMSIPAGLSKKERMPIGLQIIGKHWDEHLVLRLAYHYQRATNWHKLKPPKV